MADTALAGQSIDTVFDTYAASEFASLSSLRRGAESELLTKYNLRK